MRRTLVINAVGLTASLLGEHTPHLSALARQGKTAAIGAVLPAVTCPVQATYLTGTWPEAHGIVGNGWYFRDECEVKFWRQSNALVQQRKIWDLARAEDPSFTCANLFWWFNMYSGADYTVTPRPIYSSDGRKAPDIYTQPGDLRDDLQRQLGVFPLFEFWGPGAGIRSTQWIADAAECVNEKMHPTLTLVYLPHLDYVLQRQGPQGADVAAETAKLDAVCGQLINHFQGRGAQVVVLSEYGISAVRRPVHLNRVLRERGLLKVRVELGRELLDAGASAAFAVADHQVAHVYVNDPGRINEVRALLEKTPGVERVLDRPGQTAEHLAHARSGELLAVAESDAWFTYYYWLDEARRPDFARTVDIHRKPGYDPAELFFNPQIPWVGLKVALTLAKKKLGLRTLMEVIATNGEQVRGSHGRAAATLETGAMLITQRGDLLDGAGIAPTDVMGLILRHLRD